MEHDFQDVGRLGTVQSLPVTERIFRARSQKRIPGSECECECVSVCVCVHVRARGRMHASKCITQICVPTSHV